MATIETFYNASNIVSLWEQIKGEQYKKPLAALFPYLQTNEVDIKLARGYKRRNVALDLVAWDSNSRLRGFQPVSTESHEIPMFKNSVLFTEKMRRDVMQAVALANSDIAVATALSEHMANVVDLLPNGADVIGERYRAQLLQKGAITVSSDSSSLTPVGVSINYDTTGEWRKNNVGYWSARPSIGGGDLLGDLVSILQLYSTRNGTTPALMIMSPVTLLNIMKDPTIANILNTSATFGTLEDLIGRKSGVPVTFMTNASTYQIYEDTTDIPYWEDDVISVVPNRVLGRIMTGTTPTQYDEMYSQTNRDVKSTSENFCIQCKPIDDPIQTEVICSACLLPRFDAMDNCFVLRGE